MNRETWVPSMAGVAAGAYALHGLVTDTGPAGWINYLQQAVFGSYSMKLTMFGLMVGVFAVVALAWWFASIGQPDRPSPVLHAFIHGAGGKPTGNSWQMLVQVCAGFIVVTWAIGFGAVWWNNRIDREDSAATYEPVIASDNNPMPTAGGTHVALGGRLLRERVVEFSRGSSSSRSPSYYLVPVVAPGWREGQPASYVIKVDRIENLAIHRVPPMPMRLPVPIVAMPARSLVEPPPVRWLGRVEGQVPVPAAQEFRKMGVPLPDGGQLVRWIPSSEGKPTIRDEWDQQVEITTYICAGLTVLYLLLFPLMGWSSNRAQRKASSG